MNNALTGAYRIDIGSLDSHSIIQKCGKDDNGDRGGVSTVMACNIDASENGRANGKGSSRFGNVLANVQTHFRIH